MCAARKWFPADFLRDGKTRHNPTSPPKSTYHSQLRETGAGQLQPAPKGGGRVRLARSDKSVQIFPGIPPLAFTAAHLSAARSEQLNPPLEPSARPVEHLDLAAAIKVSQAVTGGIGLERLIDMLMRTAVEQAGAERGLLIRPRGVEQRIEAEATTSGDSVIVQLRDEPAGAAVLPELMLHYVLRTGETVVLDDAAAQSAFGEDPYIRERQTRSILCLPLINQGKLNGVVSLENNLTRSAFTPARVALLKLLASQAAISLENATLYQALLEREQQFRDYLETASDWYWETDTDHKFRSEAPRLPGRDLFGERDPPSGATGARTAVSRLRRNGFRLVLGNRY